MTRIYHCVEIHGEPDARKQRAQKTWDVLYRERGVIPCHYKEYKRTARDIGDSLDLPYFKDVIQMGLDMADAEDAMICFTNDDLLLHPLLPDALKLHISLWEACSARRCEFKTHPYPGSMASPEEWVAKSDGHCGRDLFAATKRWWVKHWDGIGDFVLGSPVWDIAMAAFIRHTKGFPTTRHNLENDYAPCELVRGTVGHIWHDSEWAKRPASTPSHRHNAELFKRWASVNLPQLVFHGDMI